MTIIVKPGPVTAPGLYRMDAAAYHKDPCVQPSLSASTIITLLESSPFHAWYRHPKFNPRSDDDASRKMEIGSAAHKIALDAGDEIFVIDADSYRTKDAQAARADAIAKRMLPVLAPDFEDAKAVGLPLREAAEAYLGMKIADCLREVVICWQDKGGGWRRAMLDAVTPDLQRPLDLKSTGGSAAPFASVGRIFDAGYHIQGAHYLNGLDAVDPANRGRRKFAFIFGENEAPYAVSPPLVLSEGALTLARSQVEIASALWDSCVKADNFPGYESDPTMAEPPPWVLSKWEMRMNTDQNLNPIQPEDSNAGT